MFEQLPQQGRCAPRALPEGFLEAGRLTIPLRAAALGDGLLFALGAAALFPCMVLLTPLTVHITSAGYQCVSDLELPASLNQGPTSALIYGQKQTGNMLSRLCVVLIVNVAAYSICNYEVRHSEAM